MNKYVYTMTSDARIADLQRTADSISSPTAAARQCVELLTAEVVDLRKRLVEADALARAALREVQDLRRRVPPIAKPPTLGNERIG